MEELRFALLILGGCAIIAILAHGLWSLRKNNKPHDQPRVEPTSHQSDPEGFDEFGIGEVRVVSQNSNAEQTQGDTRDNRQEPGFEEVLTDHEEEKVELDDALQDEVNQGNLDTISSSQETHAPEPEPELEPEPEPTKLYGSVVTNPKPAHTPVKPSHSRELKAEQSAAIDSTHEIPEPPPFLLNTESAPTDEEGSVSEVEQVPDKAMANDEVSSFSLDQTPENAEDQSLVSQTKRMVNRKRNRSIQRKRVEPSLGEDQMRIDFDSSHQNIKEPIDAPSSASKTADSDKTPEQEVLVLNVRAPSEQEIQGAALLPMLLTLGFKFGDQDIFHRHVNSNGKGPVLFSLANMFKPGVFDIDNLENFTTQGVSLFMILPIEGDPHQVFNMMHNAARKLAEEFSCQILDGRRSVLTKQGLQQYVEKIREFERQRIISRS